MMRLREMAARLQQGRVHQQMHFQAVTLSSSLAGEGGIARTMDLLPGLGLPLAKEVCAGVAIQESQPREQRELRCGEHSAAGFERGILFSSEGLAS